MRLKPRRTAGLKPGAQHINQRFDGKLDKQKRLGNEIVAAGHG